MKNRNLIPILSIEGNEEKTDQRRGKGVYGQLTAAMSQLFEHKVMYGASVTVTTENMQEVTSDNFLNHLYKKGCKAVIYVEYVPVNDETRRLAPQEEDRSYLEARLTEVRRGYDDMLFVSFPGDEKASGGCLAAGRGFFHINSHGGAEPCPFSPYSDTSLKTTTLRAALKSPLFLKLREQGILTGEHTGGCVLFEKEEMVRSLAI